MQRSQMRAQHINWNDRARVDREKNNHNNLTIEKI